MGCGRQATGSLVSERTGSRRWASSPIAGAGRGETCNSSRPRGFFQTVPGLQEAPPTDSSSLPSFFPLSLPPGRTRPQHNGPSPFSPGITTQSRGAQLQHHTKEGPLEFSRVALSVDSPALGWKLPARSRDSSGRTHAGGITKKRREGGHRTEAAID